MVPIIGVTGNVLEADRDFFFEHGANVVLHKPLDIASLEASIDYLNVASLSPSPQGGPGGSSAPCDQSVLVTTDQSVHVEMVATSSSPRYSSVPAEEHNTGDDINAGTVELVGTMNDVRL